MNPVKGKCGTDCNTCSFRERFHCGGCPVQQGAIFWGECTVYRCAAQKGLAHCGTCSQCPCGELARMIENGHNPDRLSNLMKWKNE